MNHLTFGTPQTSYDTAILIKSSNFKYKQLESYYVTPLVAAGIDRDSLFAMDLAYNGKKCSLTEAKAYLARIMPLLLRKGINTLYVADALYFKALTGLPKAEPYIGYVIPCSMQGYETMSVVLGLNYGSLTYNPNQTEKLDLTLHCLVKRLTGTYTPIGEGIIKTAFYPDVSQIEQTLNQLLEYPKLTIDIEGFGLKLNEAGIGTIAFAWDEHNGVAFKCDLAEGNQDARLHSHFSYNKFVREKIKWFFERYKGTKIYHNAAFDVKHLIFNLWMKHPQDYQGMLYGLDLMCKNMEDSKLVAYLALNSTTKPSLKLKELAHEFAGNYAVETKDIRLVPVKDLLEYNLVDCLSTWYVYKKYYAKMVADSQEELYRGLMLKSLKIIIQMELVGMPMDDDVLKAKDAELRKQADALLHQIRSHPKVIEALNCIKLDKLLGINAKRVNAVGLEYLDNEEFNPNSPNQLKALLYDILQLPVIDLTDTREPAVGGDTIKKLANHTKDPEVKELLSALRQWFKLDKVIGTFFKAFNQGILKADGRRWLHGNFNLGGTVSGRLSSSGPNMQNMPAKGELGKAVKSVFRPPEGWLFTFEDFNALEDRVNTLLTRDPNKEKIYTQGYDGHCYRAYYYWGDEMPLIKDMTVDSINSIKKLYPDHRDNSKAPSFALQYLGTWKTLVNNNGFSDSEAQKIERNYHTMYKVSDEWLNKKLDFCNQHGYIDVAFGLRIRTPALGKTILNSKVTPREAEAEARSAGNAISGQSYGLLNNRAAVEFMDRVWASKYRYDILLISLIHDAIYVLCKNNIEIVKWVNDNLSECMAWQELPEIMHPEIKLSGELDVCFRSWAEPITLNNHSSIEEIQQTLRAGAQEYLNPKSKDK